MQCRYLIEDLSKSIKCINEIQSGVDSTEYHNALEIAEYCIELYIHIMEINDKIEN